MSKETGIATTDEARLAEAFGLLGRMLDSAEHDKQFQMRKSFVTGLFAHYIKEVIIPAKEFGQALQKYLPHYARLDAKTKRYKATSALSEHLAFSKDTVENAGLTLTPVLERLRDCCGGEFPGGGNLEKLLIADATLPESLKPAQKKLSSFVGDQSKRQLIQRFRQCDADGNPMRGRRPGEGGKPAAPTGTIEEILAHAQKMALRKMGLADKFIQGLGWEFMALDDDAVHTFCGTLERSVTCMKRWLNTPPAKRDPKEIVKLWKQL